MRILFVGRPLKGHLYPIIAIYEEFKKTMDSSEFKSLEVKLITAKSEFVKDALDGINIPYSFIVSAKDRDSFSPLIILDFFKSIIGFIQSMFLVFNYMPDVIFSKGSIVSLPVILVGWIFRIPIVIHESDAVASPINKFMFKFAKKVAISFPNNKNIYISKKVFFAGNPTRSFIIRADKEEAKKSFVLHDEKPVLFIMAGTEGAKLINKLVIEILPDLLNKYQIIHQCGVLNYDYVRSIVQKMNVSDLNDYHLFPYFKERAADAYNACDLVISRAGANTVSEIMTIGKPSVLIPLSMESSDKQQKNAYHYSQSGAAILVSEKNLKPHLLLNVINDLFKNHLKIIEMKRAARKLAYNDAGKIIAEAIKELGD
ncbi:MAG: UDP-N-acetylglucosamine--N-acetylmuramyl-(pentapeptide) pyrophosphoryl-undecaprenol N-acetylglucosamine transferase [Candidatus Pacebacteria bacterium]|nr:UDP-N-acetylglucosamine--N-acetylmuramyl-(pentapeptide) pyrophosphoryl-undecaprenol N-acetylglucosamine transferase [Candidatus Paceibacterota bacterium]